MPLVVGGIHLGLTEVRVAQAVAPVKDLQTRQLDTVENDRVAV